MKRAWIVFVKELFDALRDRRTLLVVLLSSVAMGPLTLVLLSTLVSQLEERAQSREVVALGSKTPLFEPAQYKYAWSLLQQSRHGCTAWCAPCLQTCPRRPSSSRPPQHRSP